MFHLTTHNTFQQPTSSLTTLPPPSPLWSTIPSHLICSHLTSPDVVIPLPTLSPTPPSCPVGTLHTRPLYQRNRPWWTPQSIHHSCRLVHVPRRGLLQSLPHHPQGPCSRMVHNPATLLHRQLRRSLPYVLHPFRWQPSTPNYHNLPFGH